MASMTRRSFGAAVATVVAVVVNGIRFEFEPQPGPGKKLASVLSSSGGVYEIRQSKDGSHTYCSCPSWKFQRASPKHRTCKHLIAMKTAMRKVA